jgi:hypothetical protein
LTGYPCKESLVFGGFFWVQIQVAFFGLWSFRFPLVLVRTGRRLPVQALGERRVSFRARFRQTGRALRNPPGQRRGAFKKFPQGFAGVDIQGTGASKHRTEARQEMHGMSRQALAGAVLTYASAAAAFAPAPAVVRGLTAPSPLARAAPARAGRCAVAETKMSMVCEPPLQPLALNARLALIVWPDVCAGPRHYAGGLPGMPASLLFQRVCRSYRLDSGLPSGI